MTRKVTFAPGVTPSMQGCILNAVDHFEHTGRVFYTGRNEIRVADGPDGEINIKRYRRPAWPNRLIYTLIRKPKGERSFIYPQLLMQRGIATPPPLAYIEERTCGLIDRSYLVTRQSLLSHTCYDLGDADISDASVEERVKALARFAAHMHSQGVLHHDFSPGNILWDIDHDGNYRFEVVDTNRMTFGPVSMKVGAENLARLWGQPAALRVLIDEYAQARGADAAECRRWLTAARRKFWTRFSKRHEVKYHLNLEAL